jgi:hypothetical protein
MLEMEGETLEEIFNGVTDFLNFTFSNITQVIISMDPNLLPQVRNQNLGFSGYGMPPWSTESDDFEMHLSLSPEWTTQANDNNLDMRIDVAAHEFMHAAIEYMRMEHNASWHIGWMEEGLGTYYSIQHMSAGDIYIRYLIHTLIEDEELRDIRDLVGYSYVTLAEGYTIIKYMIDTYGKHSFLDFLDELHEWKPSLSYTANIEIIMPKVFGKTLTEFNTDWKEWLINDFVAGYDPEEIEKVPGEILISKTGWSIPTSAKKGRLVWVSDTLGDLDIYISNEDGTKERTVTSSWGYGGDAKLDDDAEWIAFTLVNEGNYEIYKMTVDGEDIARLTEDDSVDIMGSWSSSGEMAFTSNRNGDWDIFVMGSDGSNVQELIATANNEGSPAYSPKGDRIAFTSDASGNNDLYVADSDGSNIRQLTDTLENESFPSWSPNGKRIAYTSKQEFARQLMVIDVDSGSVEVLFEHPSRAGLVGSVLGGAKFPIWSSGGDEIFVAYEGGIYSMQVQSEGEEDFLWVSQNLRIDVQIRQIR